jgi:hypothetical protein
MKYKLPAHGYFILTQINQKYSFWAYAQIYAFVVCIDVDLQQKPEREVKHHAANF